MIGIIRRTDVSYAVNAGLITLALTTFFVLSATPAFAQKRVIRKWVDRVDSAPTNGSGVAPVTATDSQGDVYVAGNPNLVWGANQPQLLEVIKYNPAGTKVWSDVINTPGYSPYEFAITVDSAGNVFVGAAADPGDIYQEFVVAKVSSAGSTAWVATYVFQEFNGPSSSVGGIVVDSLGNAYLTGLERQDTCASLTTIKFSPAGAKLWLKQFSGQNGFAGASGIALDSQNDVYVTGQVRGCTNDFNPPNPAGVTIKYNTNGTQLWAAYTGKNSAPSGTTVYDNTALAVDSSGNSYVAGWFNTNGAKCRPSTSPQPLCETGYVVKYSSTGAEVWSQQNALWGSNALKLDREDNVYTAGAYITPTSSHMSVTKLNSSGTLLWNRQYQHTATGDDEAFALAVSYDSDAYVIGQSTSTNNATGLDCITLKFDYKGDLDWVAVYNGPGNRNDVGVGVAFSGQYLYVVAQSVGTNLQPGWATIEYLQDAAVVTPSSRTFASQKIGTTSAAQTVTLTNTYWGSDLKLMGIDVHGPFAQTNNCSSSIVPFGTCTITITYHPTATGVQTGSIDIYDQWAGRPAIISLTGAGTN